MLRAGSVFFLCSLVATATVYNMWLRGQVVEKQQENAALRTTVQVDENTIRSLRSEMARRDTIIAERDHRIASIEKEAQGLMCELERMQNENPVVAAWSGSAVPDDVLRMLKDRVCHTGKDREGLSAGGPDAGR